MNVHFSLAGTGTTLSYAFISILSSVLEYLPKGGHTRLAPTPSGYLHAGNALNFLLTARLARMSGSSLLLRIDDLDAARKRPEYVLDIFRSLEQFDIHWDSGPRNPVELETNWSQHLRMHSYRAVLDKLRAQGLVYGCTCTRSQLMRASSSACYPGTCRDRGQALDAPDTVWRLRMQGGAVTIPSLIGSDRHIDPLELMGDPVVRQRDGLPSYQIASLADDVDFGITFIVRGEDLLASTACQLHLAASLGLTQFQQVRFLHHPLLGDETGRKLSKSEGADSLRSMRERGELPDALWRRTDELLEAILKEAP